MSNQQDPLKLLQYYQEYEAAKDYNLTIEDCQNILFKIENFKQTLEFVICTEIVSQNNNQDCDYDEITKKISEVLKFLPKKERFKSILTIFATGSYWNFKDGEILFKNKELKNENN